MGNTLNIVAMIGMIFNAVLGAAQLVGHVPMKRPGAKNRPPATDNFAYWSFALARFVGVLVWLGAYTKQDLLVRSDGAIHWGLPTGLTAAVGIDIFSVSMLVSGNGFSTLASTLSVLLGAFSWYLGRELVLNDNIGHFTVGAAAVLLFPTLFNVITNGLARINLLQGGYILAAGVLFVTLAGLDLLKTSVIGESLTLILWMVLSGVFALVAILYCFLAIKWHPLKRIAMPHRADAVGQW
jgi:hypothetical protein